MGVLNQKVKKSIQNIGIQTLPSHYSSVNNRQYESLSEKCKLIRFIVLLQKKDAETYIQSLKFRRENPDELIQVNYASVKNEKEDYCKLYVYIENININLEQIMRLPFQEMIKILYFSLKGFQKLFKHYGKYFTIESHMIGWNQSSELKVWADRNYSNYEPKTSYSFMKTGNLQIAESCMVKELKQIFMCKIDKSTFPKTFQLLSTTFQRLISELEDKYGKKKLKNSFPELQKLIKVYQGNGNALSKQNNPNQKQSKITVAYKSKQNQSSGPFIRFNYNQKFINASNGSSNLQAPKITFNNKEIVKKENELLQARPIVNINFKYEAKNKLEIKGFDHNLSTNGSSLIEERDYIQQICQK